MPIKQEQQWLSKILAKDQKNKDPIVSIQQHLMSQILITEIQVYIENGLGTIELFKKTLKQVSQIIFKLLYEGISKFSYQYPKDIIGFYELVKYIQTHKNIACPISLKIKLKNYTMKLLLAKIQLKIIKQIHDRRQQEQQVAHFMYDFKFITQNRINQFQSLFGLQITQLCMQILNNFLNKQSSNDMNCTVQQLILCCLYSGFLINRQKCLFGRICEQYQKLSFMKIDRKKLLSLYNSQFFESFQQLKGNILQKVIIIKPVNPYLLQFKIQQDETILDFSLSI